MTVRNDRATSRDKMGQKVLKIGTRGSPLALHQTELVEAALLLHHPDLQCERVIIKTSGDWKPEQGEARLSEAQGGKGLFAREIEIALLNGDIDCAVHSMKDMPSFLPPGLALDHVLKRSDPRDAFICHTASSLTDLPHGATVGTAALRRQAFILSERPDIKIVPLRGNVHTRLAKLKEGQVDATYLAMAGLTRLGIDGDFIHPIDISDMLPACGQGIVTIETREGDTETRNLVFAIHHHETGYAAAAERAALQVLDGSCHTPIGAYARMEGGMMRFDLSVASTDGRTFFRDNGAALVSSDAEAASFGASIAERLKCIVPPDIFQ